MKILMFLFICLFSYGNCFSKIDFRYKIYQADACRYVHVTMYDDHDTGTPADDTVMGSGWFKHCDFKNLPQNDNSDIGLQAKNATEISVYPNPVKVNESLNIALGNANVNLISVVNSQGQILVSKKGQFSDFYNLSLDGLRPGIYWLILKTDTYQIINKKLFIL